MGDLSGLLSTCHEYVPPTVVLLRCVLDPSVRARPVSEILAFQSLSSRMLGLCKHDN